MNSLKSVARRIRPSCFRDSIEYSPVELDSPYCNVLPETSETRSIFKSLSLDLRLICSARFKLKVTRWSLFPRMRAKASFVPQVPPRSHLQSHDRAPLVKPILLTRIEQVPMRGRIRSLYQLSYRSVNIIIAKVLSIVKPFD